MYGDNVCAERLNIAFIIPYIIKGGGGARNIFRAAKYLLEKGHAITFYCKSEQNPAEVKKEACENFYAEMKTAEFVHYTGVLDKHDVGIATFYETAFSLKYNIDKIKYPFYFVQDYEAAFFPMSYEYILAESTYQMGFTHICSGYWCKRFLERKYNAKAEFFQFPIDREIYYDDESVHRNDNRIIFFAKPEMPRRCYKLGIAALRKLKKIRPETEIILFGSDELFEKEIDFDVKLLGLLPTLRDLSKLYRTATLGLVFSTTNPSLVPYEMMMCGCPVCDLEYDNAIEKYGMNKDNVFLLSIFTDEMAFQLKNILDNKEKRIHVQESGYRWVCSEFPTEEEMGERFESIIVDTINNKISN